MQHAGKVWSVAFSPDSLRLATASDDKTARIWTLGDRKEVVKYAVHTNTVTAVAFTAPSLGVLIAGEEVG